ncbi:hypothetical protein Emin_0655 [Elusimicrobium minutum Pei191]|uniref:Uncharacterized protein n=1 Tax=Elusimicrobium minutum (strain Pei191) TaxID=445932 RepID=B2KC83_ELUMP|nr:hypothetical protein [Elusimicrobium minutum]ACC98210.1 hypothetical protein Emin_0655 [Elusimicrobium minutum Pei191]
MKKILLITFLCFSAAQVFGNLTGVSKGYIAEKVKEAKKHSSITQVKKTQEPEKYEIIYKKHIGETATYIDGLTKELNVFNDICLSGGEEHRERCLKEKGELEKFLVKLKEGSSFLNFDFSYENYKTFFYNYFGFIYGIVSEIQKEEFSGILSEHYKKLNAVEEILTEAKNNCFEIYKNKIKELFSSYEGKFDDAQLEKSLTGWFVNFYVSDNKGAAFEDRPVLDKAKEIKKISGLSAQDKELCKDLSLKLEELSLEYTSAYVARI